jgi:hypothetical protein
MSNPFWRSQTNPYQSYPDLATANSEEAPSQEHGSAQAEPILAEDWPHMAFAPAGQPPAGHFRPGAEGDEADGVDGAGADPLDRGDWWVDDAPARPQAGNVPSRGAGPGNPAAHIFDFHLPEETSQTVHALHAHAEFLLDEMEMAGADQDALAPEPTPEPTPSPGTSGPSDANFAPLPGEEPLPVPGQNGLTDPAPAAYVRRRGIHSQVLPETELPTIRNRPAPALKQADPEWEEFDLTGRSAPSPAQPILPLYEPILSPKPINAQADPARSRPAQPTTPERARRKEQSPPVSVTSDQAIALSAEIELVTEEVNQLQRERREITGHALSLLEEARRIVRNQPERLGRAEYNLRQVRGILERTHESRRRSVRNMVQIFFYLSLCLGLCVAGVIGLVRYPLWVDDYLQSVVENPLLRTHSLHLLWTLLGGATGGVIGAIFGVVGQQRSGVDFDRQYVVRYLIQPIMGILLALLTYFILLSIFNNLSIDLASQPQMRWIPVGIATVAGIWQQVVYSLLYRLVSLLSFRPRRR